MVDRCPECDEPITYRAVPVSCACGYEKDDDDEVEDDDDDDATH